MEDKSDRSKTRDTESGFPLGPGILLGIGLGAFVDGILLHQILQWHHMVSSPLPPTTVANLRLNTLWDGLFHAGAWIVTVIGVIWLWRLIRAPGNGWAARPFVGSMLVGWGLFNLVEGIVDHFLLGIHHVKEGPDYLAYDIGFIILALAVLAAGWVLTRSSVSQSATALR